jgi:hypothetical protein
MQGEALNEDSPLLAEYALTWNFLAYVDLVPGNIKLAISDKGIVVFAKGVEGELVREVDGRRQ